MGRRSMMRSKNTKNKKCGFLSATKALVLVLAVGIAGFVLFFAVKLLKLDAWQEFDSDNILGAPETLIIYDKDDREALRLHAAEDRVSIDIKTIPQHVKMAFISAEDARFYDHPGIDLIRIAGAAWQDIKAGSYVQGASTITQQLIKLSHLSADKTMSRKLEEAVLAYQMEKRYSKDDILEMYMNYVYFGRGYYGIEAAALGYFGLHAEDLSIAQAATLAGILKSPSNYAPHLNKEKSLGRRNNILSLMEEYGHISSEEKAAALKEPLDILAAKTDSRGYYIDTVLKNAAAVLDITTEELLTGGYRIYTSLDVSLQQTCETLFVEDSLFPARDCEGAIVVMEADTGAVSALVGGREQNVDMAFNRATDIRRQPGSVIKPIISYAPAMEFCGYTAASMLLDEPTAFSDYSPRNFNDQYYGWVTLREAVRRSLNVPAVKVLNEIGIERGKEFASAVGIRFDKDDTSLTIALGGFTYGVSPMEIAGAYGAFASGGIYHAPALIRRIESAEGECLFAHQREGTRVMREENAFILTSMLESAIKTGTGRRLGELKISLAGKTGTVGTEEGNRDAWMAAYNSEYTACVWMGYDSDKQGTLPPEATGGSYPALLLKEVFAFLYADGKTAPGFTIPEGVSEYALDAYTLQHEHRAVLANAFTPQEEKTMEYFLHGTEPNAITEYWAVPYPVKNLTVRFSALNFPHISFFAPQQSVHYKLYRENCKGGEKVLIRQWSGTSGEISYEDRSIVNGESYRYYVLPEHPELELNGKKVTGPIRQTTQIDIRMAELFLEDTELQMTAP